MFIRLSPLHLVLCAAALLAGIGAPACAQGKLEAHYSATVSGLPIGEGSWMIDINSGHYTAAASGATVGVIRALTGGEATGATRGTLLNGQTVASNYSSTIKIRDKVDEVQLTILGSIVKDNKVTPPIDVDPERVPITDAQKRGVIDPMTAILLRVPGTGDPRVPESCNQDLPVFDGRLRYNLKLTYKRMEKVQADKGYGGPAVVCSAQFVPVGGYIPTRAAIKYLVKSHDIEFWFVPISGTRYMVPFRAQIQTPFGLGVIQAHHFVSVSTGKSAKTQ